MKKLFNGLGILGSIFLTIILTVLIIVYTLILNVKSIIGKNGISRTIRNLDVVETLKTLEDGETWDAVIKLGEDIKLNEEQLEKMLESKEIKEQFGEFVSAIANNAMGNDNGKVFTDKNVKEFINTAVDEYNKVSDTKITKEERKEILDSIDNEMLDEMNKEFSSVDLKKDIDSDYEAVFEVVNGVLFGNLSLAILLVILSIIAMIALLRFSYYKWIGYAKVSTIISGIFMLVIGVILLAVPINNEVFNLVIEIVMPKIFISALILFAITALLIVVKRKIRKHINKRDMIVIDQVMNPEITKEN